MAAPPSPTFREDILPDIDDIRGIPNELGIRLYTVSLRTTIWTGDATLIGIGRGTKTTTETPIVLANGAPPKVRRVGYKETIAAGGKYQEGDFRIGPFTPPYQYGGVPFSRMAPIPTDARKHYHFILKGPDLPASGMLCEPVQEEADRNFSRYLVVRPEGVAA
ncbi:MAG: hypothetical protein WC551_07635 [Patescibacteria group bacterium]